MGICSKVGGFYIVPDVGHPTPAYRERVWSIIEMKFRERCPRNGYDAKTGHYTGPTISHVLEKLVKLVEKGVVGRVPDKSFGYGYRLKK